MKYIAILLVALLTGCATGDLRGKDRMAIEQTLREQDAAWNAGDIDGFMAGYWASPELTFSSSGTVTRGWEPTRNRYKTKYSDRAAMGVLTFSNLEIVGLGRAHALVLGRWHLQREKPAGGIFSLVMRKLDGQWVIIHDHTSSDAP